MVKNTIAFQKNQSNSFENCLQISFLCENVDYDSDFQYRIGIFVLMFRCALPPLKVCPILLVLLVANKISVRFIQLIFTS